MVGSEKMQDKIITFVLILIGLTVLYFFVSSWLTDQKKKKDEADAISLSNETALNYNNPSDVISTATSSAEAQKMIDAAKGFKVQTVARMIYDAKGIANDDEEKVFTAFGMIKNKVQLSMVANFFTKMLNVPLFEYLQSFLDYSELAKIYNIIKKLPKY